MTKYLSQESIEGFAIIGIMAAGVTTLIILYAFFIWIKDQIIFRQKRYKDKHFMKNPPKPKCYCIQCEYWQTSDADRDTGPCVIWEKWTSKDETCCRGMLRTEQGYMDEKWRIQKENKE